MKVLFAAAMLLASGTAIAQERDARGIPVQSGQPNVPAGVNQPPPAAVPGATYVQAPNAAQAFATQPATMEYPPCTRGQTDRCVQTYEGGSGTATRRARRARR